MTIVLNMIAEGTTIVLETITDRTTAQAAVIMITIDGTTIGGVPENEEIATRRMALPLL